MRRFFSTITVTLLVTGLQADIESTINAFPRPQLNANSHPDSYREPTARIQLPQEPPRVSILDGPALVTLKEEIQREPEKYRQSIELLNKEAAVYLDAQPWTITKKTLLPPSGDKHDYESQGPYWWPNPDTKDGLPYIRRDGEKNPEIDKLTDHQFMSEMTRAVKTLALASYLTDNSAYGKKAAEFLRTWFINPSTRMNPHLNYGQRIPGRTEGRDIGIIETRNLGDITDAVGLLEQSNVWSKKDQKGMEKWMAQYLDWLLNSEHGKGEARQRNNHGTWYDVQVAALALFTRQEDIARQALARARDERIKGHIEPDGSQPHELARTRSWNYSVMNLQSFFTLAALGEKVGIDLWNHTTHDGRNIVKALDFLIQYADPDGAKTWTWQQITESNPAQIVPLLYQAACRFPDRGYGDLASKLEGREVNVHQLLFPCRG